MRAEHDAALGWRCVGVAADGLEVVGHDAVVVLGCDVEVATDDATTVGAVDLTVRRGVVRHVVMGVVLVADDVAELSLCDAARIVALDVEPTRDACVEAVNRIGRVLTKLGSRQVDAAVAEDEVVLGCGIPDQRAVGAVHQVVGPRVERDVREPKHSHVRVRS